MPITEPLKQAVAGENPADIVLEEGRDISLGYIFGDIRESTVGSNILDIARGAATYISPGGLELIPVDPEGVAEDMEMGMPIIWTSLYLDDCSATLDMITPEFPLT